MRKLSTEKRVAILSALVEGNSINATCRMTGASKVTVLRLLADAGTFCAQYHNEELRHLWSKAAKRSWTIAFQNSEPEAIIDPSQGAPREKYLKGPTSLYVYVVRAGGAFPKALVRLPNGEKRTLSVADQSVAKQLGEKLYQHAVIHGVAHWLRGTQSLVRFHVTHVGPYDDKRAKPAATMAELSQLMGHHWTDVDADAYLKDERADEQ